MTERRPVKKRAVREITRAELVLGLCHEIGNILAASRLGAHLVAKGLLEGDASEAAARIEAETARAGAYLGQMRPLLDAAPAFRMRVSASEVLEALGRSLGAAAGGPRQLSIRAPRGVPDLRIDPDALHHVLVALVLAAADVTAGKDQVRVSARRRGTQVVLTIEDDGGPLEEGPAAGVAPQRGRPLVLAAATAVVRAQGGRLGIEARPRAAGTRVLLVLPAARPYAVSRSARRDARGR